MEVTVTDVLQLEIMAGARLLAGLAGIKKNVEFIDILESPGGIRLLKVGDDLLGDDIVEETEGDDAEDQLAPQGQDRGPTRDRVAPGLTLRDEAHEWRETCEVHGVLLVLGCERIWGADDQRKTNARTRPKMASASARAKPRMAMPWSMPRASG